VWKDEPVAKRRRGREDDADELLKAVTGDENGERKLGEQELLSVVGRVDTAAVNGELSDDSDGLAPAAASESWEQQTATATKTRGGQEEPDADDEEVEWEQEVEGTEVLEDPVRMYLSEIGRVHLLTSKDERVLARKVEGARHHENLEKELEEAEGRRPKAWEVCVALLQRLGHSAPLVGSLL